MIKEVKLMLEVNGGIVDECVSSYNQNEIEANKEMLKSKHKSRLGKLTEWSIFYTLKSLAK